MIDFKLLLSLSESVGVPCHGGRDIFTFSYSFLSGKQEQYRIKNIVFLKAYKKTDELNTIGMSLVQVIPEYIRGNRQASVEKMLSSLIAYYNGYDIKPFSVLMSSYSCNEKSLSKEMKSEFQKNWYDLKPSQIPETWWNNDFFRLLQSKDSPQKVRETIRKQVKNPDKLMRCPPITKAAPKPKKLFLNIESTGVDLDDEIVQITIVNKNNRILLSEMVKPKKAMMTGRATELNGVTDDMLKNCKPLSDIADKIKNILDENIVYAYRVDFDERLLKQSLEVHGINTDWLLHLDTRETDTYNNYAHFAGERQRAGLSHMIK